MKTNLARKILRENICDDITIRYVCSNMYMSLIGKMVNIDNNVVYIKQELSENDILIYFDYHNVEIISIEIKKTKNPEEKK